MNGQVNIDAPRRRRYGLLAVLATVALVALVLIVAISFPRDGREAGATASPAPSGSVAASATPSVSPSASVPKPDAKHGFITANKIRTEDNATSLQEPPQFQAGTTTDFKVAVSPDGKRVAVIRGVQNAQQLITFTTTRPSDITMVLDLGGTGELAGEIVWSGDGSDNVIFSVDRRAGAAITYSALRSVDLAAKKQSEVARLTSGQRLLPLAWTFSTRLGGAIEINATGGVVTSYDVVRDNTLADRTPLSGAHVTTMRATRDGRRVLAVMSATAVRWWPVDQPASATNVAAASGDTVDRADFRPGSDELGLQVTGPGARTGPDSGRFEIWSLNGQTKRKVSDLTGFGLWRADGSAAFALDNNRLIDPTTGAISDMPTAGFIYAAVLF